MTITAICYLMSFIVSSNVNTIVSISISRLLILFSSLIYGLVGVILSSIILGCYLYKQQTFGIPYFYPFAPFDEVGIKHFFIPSLSVYNLFSNKISSSLDIKSSHFKNNASIPLILVGIFGLKCVTTTGFSSPSSLT